MATLASNSPHSTLPAQRLPHSEFAERAASLHSFLENEMAQGDDLTQLPLSVVEPLREAGLFWLLLAESLGGADTGHEPFMRMAEELASANPSVGWTVAAQSIAVMVAGNFCSDAHADMIFSGRRLPVLTATYAPSGKAQRKGDGYVGSGRFAFGTGIAHADWVSSAFVLEEGGAPALQSDGKPIVVGAVLPKEQVNIVGNWRVAGMRATGSYDYEVTEQDFPKAATFNQYWTEPQRRTLTAGNSALIPVCAGHAAVALGIARKSLHEAARTASAKKRLYATAAISDTPSFQYDFSRADALYQAARTRCYQVFRDVDSKATAGEPITEQELQTIRQVTTWAHQVCRDVIVTCYGLVSSSLRLPSILARNLADGAVAAQHYIVNDMSMIDAAPAIIDRWSDDTAKHSE